MPFGALAAVGLITVGGFGSAAKTTDAEIRLVDNTIHKAFRFNVI
jgi:hypothetical protein